MINNFSNYFGLQKSEIKEIIKNKFDKNADILIGVDDPEVNELIDILVDSIAEAIETNNQQISDELNEYLQKEFEPRHKDKFGF